MPGRQNDTETEGQTNRREKGHTTRMTDRQKDRQQTQRQRDSNKKQTNGQTKKNSMFMFDTKNKH